MRFTFVIAKRITKIMVNHPKNQIRVKPSVVDALKKSEVKTAQVAEYVGVSLWTLRYVWLKDPNNQTTCPALFDAISRYLGIAIEDVTEEFTPISQTSTVM